MMKKFSVINHNMVTRDDGYMGIFSTVVLLNEKIEENEKLKQCVKFYASIASPLASQLEDNERCNYELEGYYERGGKRARQCLKELDNEN